MSNELLELSDNAATRHSSFIIRSIGIELAGDPTIEEWISCGNLLFSAERGLHFCIGDWLNIGEKKWGEEYEEAIKKTGFDYGTLRNDKYVSARVELSRRRDNLSYGHHVEVAPYTPEEQTFLLEQAERQGLSRNKLREKKESLLHPATGVETEKEEQPEIAHAPYKGFMQWETDNQNLEVDEPTNLSPVEKTKRVLQLQEEGYYKIPSDRIFDAIDAGIIDPIIEEDNSEDEEEELSPYQPPSIGSINPHITQTPSYVEEAKEKRDAHVMRVMGSSDSPEWYTPQDIIDRVCKMFGEVDTDPCSNSHETPAVPASTLYTKEDDGLSQIWTGKTYLNPPYGSEISVWTDKLVAEYKRGNVEEALALLPARIDTVWFSPLYEYLMCNVKGRIQFANSPYHAPFPCVIVYLGTRFNDFIEVFKDLGPIMRRVA